MVPYLFVADMRGSDRDSVSDWVPTGVCVITIPSGQGLSDSIVAWSGCGRQYLSESTCAGRCIFVLHAGLQLV